MAVVDYFLKIDGIDGESVDKVHKNAISLVGFSWGEENHATAGVGGGGGAGKVSMQDFHFVSRTSKASPLLFLHCASGQHIPHAVLSCRKAGGAAARAGVDFLVYKLDEVLVTSFTNIGHDGGTELPSDEFSLNFTKIEIDFTDAAGQTIKAGWDVKANKKF